MMQAEKNTLDFIIIGAQKAGTTSLFHYLREHPEISLPAGKEVPFFSHDTLYYTRGWTTYMRNLARNGNMSDPQRKWGVVTPHYMVGGVYQTTAESAVRAGYDERTVPLRIHERLPGVRLIAILRDPVERALSHHRMAATIGRERRSFDDAIADLLDPEMLEHARRYPQEMTGYVAWGEYGRILAGYFDVFPREQILIVFTDELERAPTELVRRIETFIGVSAELAPESLQRRHRVGAVERGFSWWSPSSWLTPSSPFSPQGVMRTLRRNATARAAWHAMPGAGRRRLRVPYERLAHRVVVRNRGSSADRVGANAAPSVATLTRLGQHYAPDTEDLVALLGVTPPWRADPPLSVDHSRSGAGRPTPRT
jgi:hypothetical protein